ncbi:site-specific integrase [Xanthomonas euroxanthea]|uniref:Site-specific integrase n=1 Tax=Xanthomonas euroxanthea TaxID=2259622 RepID=A0AA46CB85_9XANT|nr:site-specific integrase [Xanthomonas euroxanthea]CAE1139590.1 site-specific integrase [Xanthomonas euroxanthea]SUZ29895.1 hypothetical protein CPBF424_37440 [Xanthomonas euroxanthea]
MKMSESGDQSEQFHRALTRRAELLLGLELEDFPKKITTVFGQVVMLYKEGSQNWSERLDIEHIGYTKLRLRWSVRFHSDDYVEWMVRRLMIEKLQSGMNLRPLVELAMRLPALVVNSDMGAESVEESIFEWASNSVMTGTLDVITGVRQLYEWAWEESLPGFSEVRWEDLKSARPIAGKNSPLVTMRDVVAGPFTREELASIEGRLFSTSSVTARQSAAFLLCRDWGLRPVQLALMRVTDFSEDVGGAYVMICSVKGKRSRLRRSKSNMVKRYVAPDTAFAIKMQIEAAAVECALILKAVEEIQKETGAPAATPPLPLFPARERSKSRVRTFISNERISDYVLHSDSGAISNDLVRLTAQLAVPNSRAKIFFGPQQVLEISAYRLRRTKGTSLVLAGHSAEEVAEALDHATTATVKHYFRYSIEFHAFINQVHQSSPELAAAEATWSGRTISKLDEEGGRRRVAKLGACLRDSICPLHPTVSCYGCGQFRPSTTADHAASLSDLLDLRKDLKDSSTGLMPSQLDSAVRGAKELVLYLAARSKDAK